MSADAAAQQPWSQREGEPDGAYARFLVYCHLGPSRSIDAAYRAVVGAAKGSKRRAPGQWFRDSQQWDWPRRAEAWDVFHLIEAGRLAVARFVAVLSDLAVRLLRELEEGDVKPRSWADLLATVQVIGQHLPPETILAVCQETALRAQSGPGTAGS